MNNATQPPFQHLAFMEAIFQLSLGKVKACRKILMGLSSYHGQLDRPPPMLTIPRHNLPPMFKDLLNSNSQIGNPGETRNPNQQPVIDIAGLLMLGLLRSDYDFDTKKSTTQWVEDPLAVIAQARADQAVAALESAHKPILSAPVCALLSEFAYENNERGTGFSVANFKAAIKAGYEVGDPRILAAAVFSPASSPALNRQRFASVLPHFPDPMPSDVCDILWAHALRAENRYNSASPSQTARLRSEPGYCQQILMDNAVALAAGPCTTGSSDVIAQAFRRGANHLVEPILARLSERNAAPDAAIMLRIAEGIAGYRYSITEQKRIVGMIDAFDFQPRDMAVLSSPLPGRKGNTVLHCMVSDGSFLLARKFVEMGASTTVLNKARKTPLMCSKKRSKKMVEEITALSEMAPTSDNDRQFLLFKACRARDVKLACKMMDDGADMFDQTRRQDVITEMFIDMIKLSGNAHQKAQVAIQKILSHHLGLHGSFTPDQADRLLLRASASASDAIVKVALEKGASYHALGAGLNVNGLWAAENTDRFIAIMSTLAAAGMDPDYRTQDGVLVFEKVWAEPAFVRAVRAVELSREMGLAVDQVAAPGIAVPPARPRF